MKPAQNKYRLRARLNSCLLMLILSLGGSALTAPPHPSLLETETVSKAVSDYLTNLDQLHERGINSPDNPYVKEKSLLSSFSAEERSFNVLALLVDFSDKQAQVSATQFDSLIYDSTGNTIRTFYEDFSYGQLKITTLDLTSATGWFRAPNSYAYYTDGESGLGNYPNNAQRLVEQLVDMADPFVDFSDYDNNNDGLVDLIMVIHAGPGAEYVGGSGDYLWSHKYAITPRSKDGVYVSSYTLQPEYWSQPNDMTIGVYAHELGHAFGLPDLYDTDYSSVGIGRWGLMAYGAWNGPTGHGENPAHPCAWSRIAMGFAQATIPANAEEQIDLTDVKDGGQILKLYAGISSSEYFLVENRQQSGFDSNLPGHGLMIWHIDDAKVDNTLEWYPGIARTNHFKVALVQADNAYELEHDLDYGDASDPFPGNSSNNAFTPLTAPAALNYGATSGLFAITEVSENGSIVSFNLSQEIDSLGTGVPEVQPTTISLQQNYPNPFNPTTVIEFELTQPAEVDLTIYNLLGQVVRNLYSGNLPAGVSSFEFNSVADDGRELASGAYFYRIVVNGQSRTRKMLLVR